MSPRLSWQRLVAAAPVVALALALAGCSVPKAWTYTPSSGRSPEPFPLVVGIVAPFDDSRPPASQDQDSTGMAFIPLWPFGPSLSYRPEVHYGEHLVGTLEAPPPTQRERELQRSLATIQDLDEKVRLEEEMRRLVAARQSGTVQVSGGSLPDAAAVSLLMELRASESFGNVRVVRTPQERASVDLLLTGELVATEQRQAMMCYGLTICGPVFWMLGAPAHTFHVRTQYIVRMVDYQGRTLEEFEYSAAAPTKTVWHWGAYYYMVLPDLWAQMNRRFVQDLQTVLAAKPRDYWSEYAREARLATRQGR